MEGLTELIPFLVEEGNPLMWTDFLRTCKELKIFVKKSGETVPTINSLLNEPKCRIFGLRILNVFLTQCPKSVVNVHIINWIHQCIKGLIQPSVEQTVLSFTVLRTLLELSVEFPDVRKHTSQIFIPKILDTVVVKLTESRTLLITVLECLFACLFYYGKSCGNHKVNIEKCLVNLLLNERGTIVLVSKCFHLLAQTGAPGADSINYKQNWHSQQLILLNSLHFVLDQLFTDVNEILSTFNQSSGEKRKLELPIVNDDYPFVKSQKLNIMFCGLCQMLETMLLDRFPTGKKIQPELLLGLVCRTLAVTCKSLESKISNTTYAVMSQICDVHVASLKLLNSLMLCSRTTLLPFCSLISKLFVQVFKSTDVENWIQGREKPFPKVRETSYKCLLTWLTIGKSCSFPETQVNSVIDALIKDVKCEKKVVTLNLEQKSKSKTAKKMNVTESSETMEINADTCVAALACIPPLLRIPLTLHTAKRLQEVVTKIIFEIQRELKYDDHLPSPYYNSKCRAMLYSALWALCISPHPRFPPPLHYANVLFNSACSDRDAEVQKICSFAINSISHMLRPSAPSFEFYVDLDSEIIPINPYPDPSEKSMGSQSSQADSSTSTSSPVLLNKINNLENVVNDKTVLNHSFKPVHATALNHLDADKNNLCKPVVADKHLITIDSSDKPKNAELIDLDDSSDESLILVDTKENNFPDSERIKTVSSDNIIVPDHSYSVKNGLSAVGDKSHLLQQTSSLSQKKNSGINLERSDNANGKSTNSIGSKKNIVSDEVKIIEVGYSSSHLSDSDEIIEISQDDCSSPSSKKNIQSRSQIATKRNETRLNSEVIEVDSSSPVECFNSNPHDKTSSVKRNSKIRSNNEGKDVLALEEVTIIESPKPRRSKRNIITDIGNSSITICDDEDHLTKRQRVNKSISSEKQCDDTFQQIDVDKENENDDICNVDDDEDMLCSFVDTVPNQSN